MKTAQIKQRLMDQIERAREEYTEKQLIEYIERYERDSWTYTSPDSWMVNEDRVVEDILDDEEVMKHLIAYLKSITFDKSTDTRDRVLEEIKSERDKRQTDRVDYMIEKARHEKDCRDYNMDKEKYGNTI